MASINTILPIVCKDIDEYNLLLGQLIEGSVPDVVDYTTHIETLTIDVAISMSWIIQG